MSPKRLTKEQLVNFGYSMADGWMKQVAGTAKDEDELSDMLYALDVAAQTILVHTAYNEEMQTNNFGDDVLSEFMSDMTNMLEEMRHETDIETLLPSGQSH